MVEESLKREAEGKAVRARWKQVRVDGTAANDDELTVTVTKAQQGERSLAPQQPYLDTVVRRIDDAVTVVSGGRATASLANSTNRAILTIAPLRSSTVPPHPTAKSFDVILNFVRQSPLGTGTHGARRLHLLTRRIEAELAAREGQDDAGDEEVSLCLFVRAAVADWLAALPRCHEQTKRNDAQAHDQGAQGRVRLQRLVTLAAARPAATPLLVASLAGHLTRLAALLPTNVAAPTSAPSIDLTTPMLHVATAISDVTTVSLALPLLPSSASATPSSSSSLHLLFASLSSATRALDRHLTHLLQQRLQQADELRLSARWGEREARRARTTLAALAASLNTLCSAVQSSCCAPLDRMLRRLANVQVDFMVQQAIDLPDYGQEAADEVGQLLLELAATQHVASPTARRARTVAHVLLGPLSSLFPPPALPPALSLQDYSRLIRAVYGDSATRQSILSRLASYHDS